MGENIKVFGDKNTPIFCPDNLSKSKNGINWNTKLKKLKNKIKKIGHIKRSR